MTPSLLFSAVQPPPPPSHNLLLFHSTTFSSSTPQSPTFSPRDPSSPPLLSGLLLLPHYDLFSSSLRPLLFCRISSPSLPPLLSGLLLLPHYDLSSSSLRPLLFCRISSPSPPPPPLRNLSISAVQPLLLYCTTHSSTTRNPFSLVEQPLLLCCSASRPSPRDPSLLYRVIPPPLHDLLLLRHATPLVCCATVLFRRPTAPFLGSPYSTVRPLLPHRAAPPPPPRSPSSPLPCDLFLLFRLGPPPPLSPRSLLLFRHVTLFPLPLLLYMPWRLLLCATLPPLLCNPSFSTVWPPPPSPRILLPLWHDV